MTDPSGINAVPTARLTFRTVWGGPRPQAGFIEEMARIKQRLRTVEFSYRLDLFLTVGGEITPVPGPSGLRTPRVFLSPRTATGEIRISNDDVSAAADPVAFLRHTIHQAIAELMSRVAARAPAFDAAAERAKIAFLIDDEAAPDAQAVSDEETPAAERMGR
ncbi:MULTISPECIES: hypothetical protein [unclassified Microbacterium]|uniref:hypothetical protein n=1 Tax=unclassified Microbacterium TaxID=2609290 RepID=UPI000B257813|nr:MULTISPECIES: hypothetical protein [unclassified Microbacterium]